MTCRYSDIDWRDALYNAVRNTPGGLKDAAGYLTARRGKAIATESLRKKLRGLEGESLSMEMAELLTEWMQERAGTDGFATDWIQALAVRFGGAVDFTPPAPENGWACELTAMRDKVLSISQLAGNLSGTTLGALMDGKVSPDEANALAKELRALRKTAHRMERNVLRVARQVLAHD
ncbi:MULTISPECIES: hypothetical protein [Luteimonas]|uniref:hypothetical protein n=1 Tax=Luteimonas TaxID=83614 RepID=UPI000C7C6958|nr:MULTISPECIES: hypothetical protein [Luteimonas]